MPSLESLVERAAGASDLSIRQAVSVIRCGVVGVLVVSLALLYAPWD